MEDENMVNQPGMQGFTRSLLTIAIYRCSPSRLRVREFLED